MQFCELKVEIGCKFNEVSKITYLGPKIFRFLQKLIKIQVLVVLEKLFPLCHNLFSDFFQVFIGTFRLATLDRFAIILHSSFLPVESIF
jgi:hypothetical protein